MTRQAAGDRCSTAQPTEPPSHELWCTASGSIRGDASLDAAGASGRGEARGEAAATAKPVLRVGEIRYDRGRELEYGGQIHFEYNRADLGTDSETATVLKGFRAFMGEHPEVALRVEGHTDSRGSDDYNQKLSERRAEAVRLWLHGKQVSEARLEATGLGESTPRKPEPEGCDDARPVDTTPCEEAWKANRRVEFHVTEGAETIAMPTTTAGDGAKDVPAAAPTEERRECPMLYGVRGEALGPHALVGVAGLIQPLCWLELSVGLSYGHSVEDAEASVVNATGNPAIVDAPAGARNLNIPVRGRAWFGQRHAFLVDLGVGYSVRQAKLG